MKTLGSDLSLYSDQVDSEIIDKYISDYFLLDKAKGSFNGDLIKLSQTGNGLLITMGDCIGNDSSTCLIKEFVLNKIEEIIQVEGITLPNLIINRIYDYLHQIAPKYTNPEFLMACGAINLAPQSGFFTFSSSRINLLYIGSNTFELFYSGLSINSSKKLRINNISLVPWDPNGSYYLFTDGVFDQLSGSSLERYSRSRLINLLSDIREMPLPLQVRELTKSLASWQGEIEQTDDYLILGFKLHAL
ncbi:SpoIIE family protein phosphatase [Cytophagales bacterium LB-30]|uniref:SpoIIE family protein phosphatase n=1 Tax=Shiella aurantiaca TaxID=3058365 RepID=A0ABT8F2L3_9BACT|nr:SpoIIE family protein phosphatase [Shiella aurantiaca]MDN4164680.1 SpoIIE family protein phosphatase [Shiella aurantiaca]